MYDDIPKEMKRLNNWVLFKLEPRKDKKTGEERITKVPYQCNGRNAASTKPYTWKGFSQVIKTFEKGGYDGIGFVFTKKDLITGIDFDHVRNKETGEIDPVAKQEIEALNSYTELSPSGTGLHVYVKASLPGKGRKNTELCREVYDTGRFFTVTGEMQGDVKTIEDRQSIVSELYQKWFPEEPKKTPTEHNTGKSLSDDEVLDKCNEHDKTGLFKDLFNGDWEEHKKSQSEADLLLCMIFAKYTSDGEQIDRLFRQSKLFRDKWDREDYRTDTISKALEAVQKRREGKPSGENDGIDIQMLNNTAGRNTIYHMLANDYLSNHNIISLPAGAYTYSDGIYKRDPVTEMTMQNDIMQLGLAYGLPLSKPQINNVIELVIIATKKSMGECEPDNKHVIVLNNGIFDLRDWTLHEFTPEKVYFSKLPIDYNPDAPVPEMFMKYLQTTFVGNEYEIPQLQELTGYAMCRHYDYQYIFYLLGDGGNGKGVYLNLLKELLGETNVASFAVHDFSASDHKYNVAELHGKFANICGDVGYTTVKNTEILKKLSSGTDAMMGRQPYGRPFQFMSFATLIFAMNRLPKKPSSTRGDKRRDLIITFNNAIGNTAKDIKGLHTKIIEAGEMQGILKWALDGLKRLNENKDFSNCKSTAQRGLEYDKKSHPMRHFVENCILELEDYDLPDTRKGLKTVLVYAAYDAYRKAEGLPELDQEEIKWFMQEECAKISIETRVKRVRFGDRTSPQHFVFTGIKFDNTKVKVENGKVEIQTQL